MKKGEAWKTLQTQGLFLKPAEALEAAYAAGQEDMAKMVAQGLQKLAGLQRKFHEDWLAELEHSEDAGRYAEAAGEIEYALEALHSVLEDRTE